MTKDNKLKIISMTIKDWEKHRDMFAAAIMCATTPEQLEVIVCDPKWTKRRADTGKAFNDIILEVMNNV